MARYMRCVRDGDPLEAADLKGHQTVLFADISGSTRLYEERGDEAARALLLECLDLMARVVARAGGRVIEQIGDELLCTFRTADAAAGAASMLQSAVSMGHLSASDDCSMRLRIGFLHGPVIESDGRIFGATVHTASRLASMAKAGQILTAKETLDRLSQGHRAMSRHFDTVVLKGLTGELEIHELPWRLDVTALRPSLVSPRRRITGVDLEYKGSTLRVDARNPRIEIGRDTACDLRVEGRCVSSLHARVTWDRGRTRFEDVSTNGTLVQRSGGAAVPILHDETSLTGNGELRLGGVGAVGAGCEEGEAAIVLYRCVTGVEPGAGEGDRSPTDP